jgi:diacylglycerol kinase family enzyme
MPDQPLESDQTGQKSTEVVQVASDRGFDVFVAAGGDGTVSNAASGLARTKIPPGIVPVGTGNILARQLGIPLDPEGCISVLGQISKKPS